MKNDKREQAYALFISKLERRIFDQPIPFLLTKKQRRKIKVKRRKRFRKEKRAWKRQWTENAHKENHIKQITSQQVGK